MTDEQIYTLLNQQCRSLSPDFGVALYLAEGGDHFSILTQENNPVVGPFVTEALREFVRKRAQPFDAQIEGKISRIN